MKGECDVGKRNQTFEINFKNLYGVKKYPIENKRCDIHNNYNSNNYFISIAIIEKYGFFNWNYF